MTTTDLLADLDPYQAEAVVADAVPTCVFAGAGSGKTRVLTYRIAYQLAQGVATADQFFISAFTRAAADEMSERIVALVGELPDLQIGTFHSLMYRFLNAERAASNQSYLNVCKDSERTRILRDLLGPYSKDYPEALNIDVDIAEVGGWISRWKNEMIHFDDQEIMETVEEASKETGIGAAARVYPLYERRLNLLGKIDFDDMLLKAYDLFVMSEGALARARQKWSAFFIDEAQDTNGVQWGIIKLIAPPESKPNLTIVGDTRQCLYRFRGALPELMDGFEGLYPGARRIDLTLNYRSTAEVIDRANRLVKTLQLPDQTHSRDGGSDTIVVTFDDQVSQAAEIAQFITEARDAGYRGGDVAILIRTNAQSAQLERAMVAANLPYWCKNGGFFDRMEVGDLVAYLRLAHTRSDEQALRRIINKPTRYLGAAFCDAVVGIAARTDGDLVKALRNVRETRGRALSQKQKKAAEDLADLMDFIGKTGEQAMSPFMAIHRVLEWTDYLEWLRRTSGSEGGADDSRAENVKALENVAMSFGTLEQFIDFIILTNQLQQETNDATEICTVHRSKGREWPIVIVSNFFDNSFPHKRAVMEGNLQDERRIAYVAFTRARDILVVTCPGEDDKGAAVFPSPFLWDAGLSLPVPDDLEGLSEDDLAKTLDDQWWGSVLEGVVR